MPFFENKYIRKGRVMSTQGSIRIESKSKYTIEVNDKGETIAFDLADFRLPAKLLNVYTNLEELTDKYEQESKSLLEREDIVVKTIDAVDLKGNKIEETLTQNTLDIMNLTDAYYTDSRNILDEFLGKDACQKIFGDTNYENMFDDLLEQLEPHFKKMGLNYQKMQKGLVNKYMPKDVAILK